MTNSDLLKAIETLWILGVQIEGVTKNKLVRDSYILGRKYGRGRQEIAELSKKLCTCDIKLPLWAYHFSYTRRARGIPLCIFGRIGY